MTNEYKLLFLDIDGTLTNSKKEITPFTRQTLIEAQRNGLRLVLASGRPVYGIAPLAKCLEMEKYGGYILAFNGGRIIDCQSQTTIFQQALPLEEMTLLYHRCTEAGATFLTYDGDHVLTEDAHHPYVGYVAFLNKMTIRSTDNFLRDAPQPIYKCLAVAEPELLVKLETDLKKALGDRANVYRSEPFILELVPKGIDKAASIERLLQSIGVRTHEIIAIGDGFNDLSMIQYAGVGVAMANAQEVVKAGADRITIHTNDEDGVAHFLLRELK